MSNFVFGKRMNPEATEKSITVWRKQLQFRAWHRGTREADLIMGPFAAAMVPTMNLEELERFESLLHCPDPDVYDWLTGKVAPPTLHESFINRLKEFEYQRGP